jgi:hypothetical protein
LWVAVSLVLLSVPRARAIEHGGFDAGLNGWKAAWHVSVSAGEAALSDEQATHAFLFQADPGLAGQVTVAFDFLNDLSADVPEGTFRDSFYVSVYQVDTHSDFILEHDRFDAAHGLMDLDAGGSFDLNGNITASPKGGEWLRFEGSFTVAHAYVVLVFELHNLNLVAGDSSVRIDNVAVAASDP